MQILFYMYIQPRKLPLTLLFENELHVRAFIFTKDIGNVKLIFTWHNCLGLVLQKKSVKSVRVRLLIASIKSSGLLYIYISKIELNKSKSTSVYLCRPVNDLIRPEKFDGNRKSELKAKNQKKKTLRYEKVTIRRRRRIVIGLA